MTTEQRIERLETVVELLMLAANANNTPDMRKLNDEAYDEWNRPRQ